jgi:hypothetical protein
MVNTKLSLIEMAMKTGDQGLEDTAIFKEESLKTLRGIVKSKSRCSSQSMISRVI